METINNENEIKENIIYIEKIVYKILPSLKKAQKKYVENNRELIRAINTKHYNKIKSSEEYKKKKSEYYELNKEEINKKQRERYLLKKALKK
jgi:hypothetical protein